ncbi:MAG: DUF3810 domain-containing protein [Ruminococcaceae bacterium]|nr:DUF3810 domain-containing protein [Oscillospiraceae bacterium]
MKKRNWILTVVLLLPVALLLLFRILKENGLLMERWVLGIVAPVAQFWGRVWSAVPVSGAELLTVFAITGAVVWMVWTVVRLIRERSLRRLLRRLLLLVAAVLWLVAGLDWLWNAAYYAPSFAQRSGLEVGACSVEELTQITRLFGQKAGELSVQVPRDAQGHFAVSPQECLERGVCVYDGLIEEFAFLSIPSVSAKPLFFSRLQSVLGFTGVYFPFTGEANVNVDAPACLLPATVAHEMAHQRMVAAEEEANFVGIAACITCKDPAFQYSGYLLGLIHLSNALYSVDREAWYEIRAAFPEELVTDWNDNNAYWAALASPVEDLAEQAYDSFLKGNGQTMGIRSYGACVDLLVAWTRDSL